MARAIHGFKTECFSMRLISMFVITLSIMCMLMIPYHEQVFLVVFIMTRNLPQVDMKHIWSYDFLISPSQVLISHQVHKFIIYFGAMSQKESAAWCQFVEEKEVLSLAHDPVITF
jgi:hypothetical protein